MLAATSMHPRGVRAFSGVGGSRAMAPPAGRAPQSARSRAAGGVCVRASITLYTNPGSRGKIPEWYLAELNVPHETKLLDMRRGEHKQPAFLAINPFGKVPALTDGDVKLFESGGILLHLANKYGKLSPDELGVAAAWTLFANSTLSEAFFNSSNRSQMTTMLSTLNGILATKPYLAGPDFSVSDIAVGSYLLYLPLFFPDMDLTPYAAVWDYMQRIAARPNCPAPYREAMAAALESAKERQGAGAGGVMGKLFGRK